ncbi:MAG: endonuclease [Gammaproteobacteria bacterium]
MVVDQHALEALFEDLFAAYGPQGWWPGESRFEIIAGALLIQRTTWHNAARALERLREAGCLAPAPLAALAPAALAELVRPAGFYRQKAARLAALCRWLDAEGGCDALTVLSDATLRAAWLARPGIGPETADAILLYAYERPVFVVDAYARRLLARLGLARGDEAYEALRAALERALGGDVARYNEFHALIVAHAKARCATRPRCTACVLAARCTYARAAR